MKKIYKDTLMTVLDEIIAYNNEQNSDFKAGMNEVKQRLENYFKEPAYLLKDSFKNFALLNFLNNDDSKIEVFKNLIEWFEWKMSELDRDYSWMDGEPDYMDNEIQDGIESCFPNIQFKRVHCDFDRSAQSIDLRMLVIKPEGDKLEALITEYYMEDESDEDENYSDEIEDFHNNLRANAHYETLMLFFCLKKLFKYIDAKQVESLLKKK